MCVIAPGKSGACRVRSNEEGEIKLLTYGSPCSINIDPVEKKPLFHFLPGSQILSIATAGCNLHCKFCQNWEISQGSPADVQTYSARVDELVALAVQKRCQAIAYTYTDPTVYYEYALDCSIKAREAGVKSVLVTAAYINKEPWRELCRYTDAANIDLKALSDKFYREICEAELQPVLDALVLAREMGVMLEVTNLVIPGLNDSDADLKRLARWIAENLGVETPLHFSRFFPQYLMVDREPTPKDTLLRAKQIAESEGLKYTYIGNLSSETGESTYCPGCGELLIERKRYSVLKNNLKEGKCSRCDKDIYGIWG